MKNGEKKLTKKQKCIFRIMMIGAIVLLIAFFALREYYFKPRQYKKKIFNEIKNSTAGEDLTDEQIEKFVDCIYDKYRKYYGDVDDFPDNNIEQQIDKFYYESFLVCSACSGFYSKSDSSLIMEHLDSLSNEVFALQLKKGTVIQK